MINPDKAVSADVGSTSYPAFVNRNIRAYNALDKVGQHPNLFRVYPEKIFCNKDLKDRCIVQKGGRTLYLDDDHLSNEGAKLLVDKVVEQIN